MAPAAQRGGGAIALLAQGDPPHKGQDRRHISPGPAGKSLSRQARRQPILEPSRNPSEADSTPSPTARWRIVTDHPSLHHSLRSAGAISLSPHTPCRIGAAGPSGAGVNVGCPYQPFRRKPVPVLKVV